MNKKLQRAIERRITRHTYGHVDGRVVVFEPEIHDGCIVCTLHGDPTHGATMMQAEAICAALDRLMKRYSEDN